MGNLLHQPYTVGVFEIEPDPIRAAASTEVDADIRCRARSNAPCWGMAAWASDLRSSEGSFVEAVEGKLDRPAGGNVPGADPRPAVVVCQDAKESFVLAALRSVGIPTGLIRGFVYESPVETEERSGDCGTTPQSVHDPDDRGCAGKPFCQLDHDSLGAFSLKWVEKLPSLAEFRIVRGHVKNLHHEFI